MSKGLIDDEEEAATQEEGAASAAPSKKRPRAWIATNYDEDGNVIRPKRTRVPSKKAAATAAAMKPAPEAIRAK